MRYGLDKSLLKKHKNDYWTFKKYIIEYEGFNSLKQYDAWLSEMNNTDSLSTRWYYTEKYLEILKILA